MGKVTPILTPYIYISRGCVFIGAHIRIPFFFRDVLGINGELDQWMF